MNIKKIFTIFCLVVFLSYNSGVKATEECFEGFSRSVFKFNLVFDDIILEPIAKGYSKLPKPIKTGTSNFTLRIQKSNINSVVELIPIQINEMRTIELYAGYELYTDANSEEIASFEVLFKPKYRLN